MPKRMIWLTSLCAISILIMVLALVISNRNSAAEFVPPPFDNSAVIGVPEVNDDLEYAEVNASVYTFLVCGKPCYDDDNLLVYLTNPSDSNVWLRLRLYDLEENMIGESGVIRPGEYIESVKVISSQKSESVVMKIMAYEPISYFSAGVVTLNTSASWR